MLDALDFRSEGSSEAFGQISQSARHLVVRDDFAADRERDVVLARVRLDGLATLHLVDDEQLLGELRCRVDHDRR